MRLIVRGIDILFLARPIVIIPVWGFSVFGYWCGLSAGRDFTVTLLWSREAFLHFYEMALFSLAVGAVYVLNQIADYEVDARNEGFPLLVKSGIARTTAYGYAGFLGCISIGIPLAALNYSLAIFSFCAILLGVIYSFKPVYLSGRIGGDFLTNATGYGIIAFAVGWHFVPERSMLSMLFIKAAAPYFFLMCGGSIGSTLPDVGADSELGKRTTAVVLGISRAHYLATLFVVAGAAAALINRDFIALIMALCALIIDVLYAVIRTKRLMEATYKVGGGIAMLLAGILYPVFIPCALFIFILTWLYFRVRHKISYPSLVPVANVSNRST